MMMLKSAFAASLLAQAGGKRATDIYNQPVTTLSGCKCLDSCKTSIFHKCSTAPFCKALCQGKPTTDYCKYEAYSPYESKTGAEKKALILEHVYGDKTSSQFVQPLKVLTGIIGESVRVSFEASSDIFPEERTKYIHSVGVTGGMRFESSGDHAYTGIFQGAENGIIRFSTAKAPGSSFAPGMGLKFFRDGRPSANFVAMYSLDGQTCDQSNFFHNDWSNHIKKTDNFGLKLIAAKFWQASFCPLMVGLSDLASEKEGDEGTFPFRLVFKSDLKIDCPCDDYAKCFANLETIKEGSKLFSVYAESAPKEEQKLIGSIVLTDKLSTSKFGDEELFFKHQRMEDDYAIKPDWLNAIDKSEQCGMGCTSDKAPTIAQGCSSPFNNTAATSAMHADMLTSDVEFVV